MEQRIILFRGRVQGVGFRYVTCRTASRYDVSGSVRNLPDGGVEVIVEGVRKEIDAFLGELHREMVGYITEASQRTCQPAGTYKGFTVRYG